jgi:hypothetical protein
MAETTKHLPLSPGETRIAIWLGTLLIAGGLLFCYFPPHRKVTEITKEDSTQAREASRTTTTSADPTSTSIALAAAGTFLLIFGINGLKLSKLSAGFGSMDAATYSDVVEGNTINLEETKVTDAGEFKVAENVFPNE